MCIRGSDYERFYAEELAHRRALGYPPVGRLVRVLITGPVEAETRRAAIELAGLVSSAAENAPGRELEVLGPAPAPLARLRGRYRYQLLLKGPAGSRLHGAAQTLAKAVAGLPTPLRASVDVDPVSML